MAQPRAVVSTTLPQTSAPATSWSASADATAITDIETAHSACGLSSTLYAVELELSDQEGAGFRTPLG